MESRRDILRRVAEGTLSPAEAAVLLSQVEADETPVQGNGVRRIRIAGQFGTARVVGDPSVREAVAEGPHRARREADELIIESEALSDADRGFRFHFSRTDRPWHSLAHSVKGVPLTVRMHPDLPLEVDLAAGTLAVRGVRA